MLRSTRQNAPLIIHVKTHTTTSSRITNPPRQTEANAVGEIHGGHHQPPPNNTTIAQKCGATARNASQPARRATQEHAPHTAGKQNAGAPGGAPQQNSTTFAKESRGEKRARAGTRTQTHTTSQTSTRNRVAANARQRSSEVMTLHRRPVAALTTLSYASKPTTSIQFYRVPPAGVEPATYSLRVNRSNQLSYRGFIFARSRRESNPQPPAPEAGALSVELRKQKCDMELSCALDRNRTYALRVSAGSSYQTELQGQGTCAPTRIRAGGRRARSSDGGTRTRDPELMKLTLYRLSYVRIRAANSARTLSRAPLGTAPVFIFSPGGRTRTYTIHCIRVALSPIELHRKRRKQNCGRSAPRRASTTCRFGAGGKRTSRVTERRKQNPRRSSAERFLFSSVVPPRIELGQLE